MVLAQDISDWAGAAALASQTLSVLDVGCGWGPILCQLEGEPNFDNIRISAGDIAGGYPEIGSERYDVVVCEQVLEHLESLEDAIATLVRVTRPGGTLVIG